MSIDGQAGIVVARATGATTSRVVNYDSWLVEEAVCRAVRDRPGDEQRLFHRERDPIYAVPQGEERERRFRHLNQQWFVRLGLNTPLDRALSERPEIVATVDACWVVPAASRRDELADLVPHDDRLETSHDRTTRDHSRLVVRLRPESLLDADRLLSLLRHELLHVADMLDPAFGYERDLPRVDGGPAYENLLRDRYRVAWDATIDGRLFHAGLSAIEARSERLREFARTFPMLAEGVEEEFSRWFSAPHPSHRQIVAFITSPLPSIRHDGCDP